MLKKHIEDLISILEICAESLKNNQHYYICSSFMYAYDGKHPEVPMSLDRAFEVYPQFKKFIFEHGQYLLDSKTGKGVLKLEYDTYSSWVIPVAVDCYKYRANKVNEFIKELRTLV